MTLGLQVRNVDRGRSQIQEPWLVPASGEVHVGLWWHAGNYGNMVSEQSCWEGLPTSLSQEGQSLMSKLIFFFIKYAFFYE